MLLSVARSQWFYFDEWAFLTNRGFAGNPLNLFLPHGEHWVTIPILVYRVLFAVVALHSYVPYMATLFILHIAVAHLLWKCMRRLGSDPWIASGLAVAFLFLGGGWEDLLWAFQLALLASIIFGLLAVMLADRESDPPWRTTALSWLALVAGLMCSGVGVTLVAVAALTSLFRRGLRAALMTMSVPTVVYLGWLAVIGHKGFGGTPVTIGSLLMVPAYVWNGLASTVDAASGFAGAGAVGALGIAVWLIWTRHQSSAHAVALACAIGAVVFFTITGIGRASFGVAESSAPRYVYVSTALLVPVTSLILSRLARRDLRAQIAVLGLIAFCAAQGFGQLATAARIQRLPKLQSETQILAAAQLIASGAPIIGVQPDPTSAPDLTVGELRILLQDGDLPSLTGITDAERLSAVAALETSVTHAPLFDVGSASFISSTGALAAVGADGCEHLQPVGGTLAFRLRFDGPASLSIASMGATSLQFFLQQGGDDQVTAAPVVFSLDAGRPVYLNVSDSGATPYLLSAATTTLIVCGVSAPE